MPDSTRDDTYSVYVIELEEAVWSIGRFRDRNPQRDSSRPLAYVGMTSCSIEDRFQQHRTGYRANRYARRYGQGLVLDRCRPGLTRKEAEVQEVELAEALRAEGWGVWQA